MFILGINWLIMIIFTLVGVAFITLLERKVLGYMQIRVGPNKVGLMGLLQPISDAIKLYTKELISMSNVNFMIFMISPLLSLSMSLVMWCIMPYLNSFMKMNMSMLMFLSILGISIYFLMAAGWSSNSSYALIGSIRFIAQMISYEISLSFIVLCLMMMTSSMKMFSFMKEQKLMWFIIFLPLILSWMISCLAELNRTPFDLAEGESELVSGFNIEYSSGSFAIIFMAEYMNIMSFSMLTTIFFMGSYFFTPLFFIMVSMIMFFIIWSRATLPRMRYDKLMDLSWIKILPIILFLFIYLSSLFS